MSWIIKICFKTSYHFAQSIVQFEDKILVLFKTNARSSTDFVDVCVGCRKYPF